MAGWLIRSLAQVCTIKPSKAEARARLSDGDPVSFAPMEDLGIGEKYMHPSRTRRLGEVVGSYTYFAEGDVLLAKITPCFENGKLGVARGLTNGVGFGSSEYIVLRPASTLDAEFLYYYLARPNFLEEGARTMTGAVGHKRVAKEFVESYPIPLPPLSEQRRIVAILDEAFEAIATAKANAEKNLQNARELFESHLSGICGPQVSLGQVVNITTGKLDANAAVEGGEYPFFTCSRDIYAIDDYAFDCEALLLAGNNAVGDFNVKHYEGKFNAYQRTYVITVNAQKRALCRFLYYELLKGLARFKSQSVGVGTKFLKIGMIKELQVALPNMADQHRLASLTNRIQEEVTTLERQFSTKLSTLEELKKSLLHQAFTGALTTKSTDSQVAEVA